MPVSDETPKRAPDTTIEAIAMLSLHVGQCVAHLRILEEMVRQLGTHLLDDPEWFDTSRL